MDLFRRTNAHIKNYLVKPILSCKSCEDGDKKEEVLDALSYSWRKSEESSVEEEFSNNLLQLCEGCDGNSHLVLNYARKVAGL